jgi:biotin carboxyl carrier protein
VLTSGGHNAGIVSEPGHPHRHYHIATRPEDGAALSPDEWMAVAEARQGSWWTAWGEWLAEHSGEPVAPPSLGNVEAGYPPRDAAPGTTFSNADDPASFPAPFDKRLPAMASRLQTVLVPVAALALVGGGAAWWRTQSHETLPAGIIGSNGRIELKRTDVAVKYPGRLVALRVDEGDEVHAGDVIAEEDPADTLAQLKGRKPRASGPWRRRTVRAGKPAHAKVRRAWPPSTCTRPKNLPHST